MSQASADSPYTPTVLIVEDHAETRNILARYALPLGINVVEATNGRQALTTLKRQQVDVVVSDLVMPKMSGLMLLHTMLEQGFQVPFIFVTGYSDKDSAIQALRLGAFDYLEKPVEPDDFVSILQEALRVSEEQRALTAALTRSESRAQASAERAGRRDASAEMLIMKMRAIRYRGETADFPTAKDDLKDLFIQEAVPQLQFAEAAATALSTSDNLGRDLAFLLRVIQTVRMASDAVRLIDLAEFAWSVEAAAAAIKSQPADLTAAHVELIRQGIGVLRERVEALDKAHVRTLKRNLDELAERLQKPKAS